MTATRAREYRNENLFSHVMSDVDLTGDNHENILITYSIAYKIIEVSPSNEILCEIDLNMPLGGAGIWGPYTYRSAKMPLYPYNDSTKKYSIDYNQKEGL